MREIKFRAWDKELKEMIYFDLEEAVQNASAGCVWGPYNKPENFIGTVMQYTGLKDKNGKEIYEGDILKWLREPKGKKEGSEFVMGEVKFEHQGWWCANAPKEDGQWNSPGFNFAFMLNLVEVIGNIYENPELLDTQDKGGEA